jgi:hypothetical protein
MTVQIQTINSIKQRSGPEWLHIADDDHCPITDGIDRWRMLCGAECDVHPDGRLVPHLDHYDISAGYKATCPGCLVAWGVDHG